MPGSHAAVTISSRFSEIFFKKNVSVSGSSWWMCVSCMMNRTTKFKQVKVPTGSFTFAFHCYITLLCHISLIFKDRMVLPADGL